MNKARIILIEESSGGLRSDEHDRSKERPGRTHTVVTQRVPQAGERVRSYVNDGGAGVVAAVFQVRSVEHLDTNVNYAGAADAVCAVIRLKAAPLPSGDY